MRFRMNLAALMLASTLCAAIAHADCLAPPVTTISVASIGLHSAAISFSYTTDCDHNGSWEIRALNAPIDDSNWASATVVGTGVLNVELTQDCSIVGGQLNQCQQYYFAMKCRKCDTCSWGGISNSVGASTYCSGIHNVNCPGN